MEFSRTGFGIYSETQSEDAGRSHTGHLYLDEYAKYKFQEEIWTGARPILSSNPNLRVSIASTPNGDREHFHEIWTSGSEKWSRHYCDVYKAVEQGFPLDIETERLEYTSDQWAQEFECSFLTGADQYFSADLLNSSKRATPSELAQGIWMGTDAASLIDHTGIVLTEQHGQNYFASRTWVIEKVSYESSEQRIGQEVIIENLMTAFGPQMMQIDRGAEGAELWGLLYAGPHRARVKGISVRKPWKDKWCPRLKMGLENGRMFLDTRPARVFVPAKAKDFFSGSTIPAGGKPADKYRIKTREAALEFERQCFIDLSLPVLTNDFRRVHKKWSSSTETTFDTVRDRSGHGDTFWAALFGYELAVGKRQQAFQPQPEARPENRSRPEYLDYM
ncbi:MAG: hypothetical protein GTO63_28175 [Anaerolineae bacterium]|nr:hypothetical protein [Anaerolineae bacterium]NIN98618.1 hypothetical protein [Anaerolineae bacterium]NIQ81504.1 hypothetical protein [Anaerolineae bacterium]